jgi:uncharacterized protein YbgA (DUF1722 family)
MRLVGNPDSPRLMTQQTNRDLTGQMMKWVSRRVEELKKENLCGFIFKSKSPSSGMERVKVYNTKGGVVGSGSGLFAAAFIKHFPLLPVEDEGRLTDPDLRENFMERIFALNRYREAMSATPSLKGLMDYHASHKYLIMSHSETHMRRMGRMLAEGKRRAWNELRNNYEAQLLEALKVQATPKKHANVLQHMMGYFKDFLVGDEKEELLKTIRDFKAGIVPLIVPITLVLHHVRRHRVAYLTDQYHLQPHPLELKLRNHA